MLIGESGSSSELAVLDDSVGAWALIDGTLPTTDRGRIAAAVERVPWSRHDPGAALTILDRTLVATADQGLVLAAATLARLHEDTLHLAHIGDIHAFLIDDAVVQLNEPHTLAAAKRAAGIDVRMTRPSALTRSVGVGDAERAAITEFPVAPGDLIVLCTREVYGERDIGPINKDELRQIVAHRDPRDAAQALTREAEARGAVGLPHALVVRFEEL